MHTGARLYKIPLLENKATCKVMNLIKFVHRHLKVALHRKQQINNHIHGLFIDIDRQPAMPNGRNINLAARAHHHGG